MILVDTNIFIGFLHPDPRERTIVRNQLAKIKRGQFVLVPPVLFEVMSFVKSTQYYDMFLALVDELGIEYVDPGDIVPWRDIVGWMRRYLEHEPDYVDAYLAVLSGIDRQYKVWTNDSEFRTIWRRPDGTAVPLIIK